MPEGKHSTLVNSHFVMLFYVVVEFVVLISHLKQKN